MSDLKSELLAKHCQACRPGTPVLSDIQVMESLKVVLCWDIHFHGEESAETKKRISSPPPPALPPRPAPAPAVACAPAPPAAAFFALYSVWNLRKSVKKPFHDSLLVSRSLCASR